MVQLFLFISVVFFAGNCAVKNADEEGIKLISPKDAYAILFDTVNVKDYTVFDVRGSRMDYIRGHLANAIWVIPDSLEKKINALPKEESIIIKEKLLIIYDSANMASAKKVATLMIKNGFKKVMVLDGGVKSWVDNNYPLTIQLVQNTNPTIDIKKKNITLEKVYEIIQKNNKEYIVIDLRSYLEYKDGHIKRAISIPYEPLNEFVVQIEEQGFVKNKNIIVYSSDSTYTKSEKANKGEKACDVLLRNGYTEIYLLKEGYDGWFAMKDYPISTL